MTETGLFFHIDFAHILGDKLKFGIIDRETAPFILTKEFVRVMGGGSIFLSFFFEILFFVFVCLDFSFLIFYFWVPFLSFFLFCFLQI